MGQIFNLAVLSVANVGLTFAFQWYLLTQVGPGVETDALFVGMTVPQVVLAIVNGSIVNVLVPMLAGESVERRRYDSWFFCYLIGGVFGIFSALLLVFSGWWVPLVVPGFDDQGLGLAIELTQIQLLGLIFFAVNGVQLAHHQADHRLEWAESVQVIGNLLALAALVLALPSYGIKAAAWILVARMLLQVLLLFPGMGKPAAVSPRNPTLALAWGRMKPLLLGNAYFKTDPLIDRFMLSMAASGSISLFYLGQQIHLAVSQVINKSIVAPVVAPLSVHYKSGELAAFKRLCRDRLVMTSLLSVAGMTFIWLFGELVLAMVFGRGSLSPSDVHTLWLVLLWLGGTLVGAIGGQICASVFYVCGDTTTPTRMSVVTFSVYIPAKILAFFQWGVAGLAISTSIYFLCNFLIQFLLLRRRGVL